MSELVIKTSFYKEALRLFQTISNDTVVQKHRSVGISILKMRKKLALFLSFYDWY